MGIGWGSVRRLCEVGRGWWVSWVCAAAWLGVGACGVGRVLGCCEWVVGIYGGCVRQRVGLGVGGSCVDLCADRFCL